MKRIGNIFLVVFLCIHTALCAQQEIEIHLRATTAQHLPLQEVGIDKPFLVEVSIKGVNSPQRVYVDTHNVFDLRTAGTTTQMNSINGVSTREIIYQYSARPKALGTFTLGPAVATIDGTVYTSNSIEITVAKKPVERVTLHEPKLELIVPKGPLVVGQQLPIALRFYHLGTAQLSGISSNQIPGFADGSHEGPFTGTADIDGVPYEYVEWRTHVVAHQEGTFVFEPARAVYSMQSRERTSIWQQLSDRFSFGLQQYETYSPVVHVVVEPLPPHTGKVDAVGTFISMHATVNQTAAKQGEGIVYILEISGDNAIKELNHPELTLPDTLTSYESKATISTQNMRKTQEQRKTFEYIIQARTAGLVTIPAQSFTYYDPQEHAYATLTTDPIALDITPDKNAQKELARPAAKNDVQHTQQEEIKHLPLFSQGVAEFRSDSGIKESIFWLLFSLILVAIAIQWSLFFWQRYRARNYDYLRLRASFHTARKRLARCRQERNWQELYGIFADLYADRHSMIKADVLETDLHAWLSPQKHSLETIKEWQLYVSQLQAYAFSHVQAETKIDVGAQAEKWLTVLEKNI